MGLKRQTVEDRLEQYRKGYEAGWQAGTLNANTSRQTREEAMRLAEKSIIESGNDDAGE